MSIQETESDKAMREYNDYLPIYDIDDTIYQKNDDDLCVFYEAHKERKLFLGEKKYIKYDKEHGWLFNHKKGHLIHIGTYPCMSKSHYTVVGSPFSLDEIAKAHRLREYYSAFITINDIFPKHGITRKDGCEYKIDMNQASDFSPLEGGQPLTKETIKQYIKDNHPECKAYRTELKKIGSHLDDVSKMPFFDAKIAKEMQKNHFSKERIAFAIEMMSPYVDMWGVDKNKTCDPRKYAQDVLNGKFKDNNLVR